jgi:hypothetical protein
MKWLESLTGVEEGEALIRLADAETLHASGAHAQARTAIAAARTRLLARAARIKDDRWRESYLHNVPDHRRTLELAELWTSAT